jgi:hypothetical protein
LNFPDKGSLTEILDSAVFWCSNLDTDAVMRKEIESLLVQDRFAELTKRFGSYIPMNHGKVIGKMAAGFSCFNQVMAQRYACGIGNFLSKKEENLLPLV